MNQFPKPDRARPLSFTDWMQHHQKHIDSVLIHFLPAQESTLSNSTRLDEAMRYAVLNGGKRVRPLLVFAAGELVGANMTELTRVASAIEMIHAYSLVHDDMPCMDNDILRRGKPTVHVQYGEALALLAGDALQAEAFSILSQGKNAPERQLEMLHLLAHASGSLGMCSGQAIDLTSVGLSLSLEQLEQMHQLKTGALLRASVLMGALCGQELDQSQRTALTQYARAIGLAFQVVDDILDATSTSLSLGKTAGKDEANNKPTYVSISGLDASKLLAEKCRLEAHNALKAFTITQPNAPIERLSQLADFIVQRTV